MRMISDHGLLIQMAGQLVCHLGFQVARVNNKVLSLTITDKRQALLAVEMDDESDDPLVTPMSPGFMKTSEPFRFSRLLSLTREEAINVFPFALV